MSAYVASLPAPGTVLTRECKGKTIRVTVMEDGFHCGGKDYRSLSGIAREMTGTSVNGFLWFKLIDPKPARRTPKVAANKSRRRRLRPLRPDAKLAEKPTDSVHAPPVSCLRHCA